MKYLISLVVVFLVGCSTRSEYIYIPEPHVVKVKEFKRDISVKEVVLPYYLQEGKIPYIKDGKIEFLDEYFSDNAVGFTTKRVVEILKKSFSSQRVYIYPWSPNKSYILQIDIDKFIADDKNVYLKGDWRFYNPNHKLINFSSFYKTKPISNKSVPLVMKSLFDDFIVSIAKRI